MKELQTVIIEQPGSIGIYKAAKLGRFLAVLLQEPGFFAAVEEKIEEERNDTERIQGTVRP